VERNEALSREQIRKELTGNLCRCTGYETIVNAIHELLTGSEGASK
jgi:carbon-monoxide dehydrogenase small subunit